MTLHINTLLPENTILLISGIPGAGKTTISYELLKRFSFFRIVQETDIIREILRGYNCYLLGELSRNSAAELIESVNIPDHSKIFTYEELKQQCKIMQPSLEAIVLRQQRKCIPTIVNGVHIIPEELKRLAKLENVVFINLFIKDFGVLRDRIANRSAEKYMPFIQIMHDADIAIARSMLNLSAQSPSKYINIDVSKDTVNQTVERIIFSLERVFK